MKKTIQVFIMTVSLLLVIAACSQNTPQDQMKEIDTLLNKGFPITAEQRENIEKFSARGRSLLQEGKSAEAGKEFSEAIRILKLAQDADIFNKAD